MGLWKSLLENIFADTTTLIAHFVNRELWLGKLAVQTATDWAEEFSLTPFRAISGNGDFGSDASDEAQVIGTADTPIFAGQTHFKLFRITIVASSVTTPYSIRIIWGTGTMADAIVANQYTSLTLTFDNFASVPFDIVLPELLNGNKIWVQCKNATDNATIDFFVGVFGS